MGVKVMKKPTFNVEQIVSASAASKHFGELRQKARVLPQFISDNGNIDTVVLSYDYFEKMYKRLMELEEEQESDILLERINRLEKDPSLAVSWKSIKRSGKKDE